jgi:hypothetical protein
MLNETRLDIASFAVRGHEVHETAHLPQFHEVQRLERRSVGWLWCAGAAHHLRRQGTS